MRLGIFELRMGLVGVGEGGLRGRQTSFGKNLAITEAHQLFVLGNLTLGTAKWQS